MSNVPRYFGAIDGQSEYGDWVHITDYLALEQKLAEAEKLAHILATNIIWSCEHNSGILKRSMYDHAVRVFERPVKEESRQEGRGDE